MLKHRWRLKFTAYAKGCDLIRLECTQISLVAENDPPSVGLDLAADDIEQGGFACAVRANQGAELPTIDVQVDPPQGLEAIEGDRDIF